jgi:hypothetical protein
MDKFWENYIKTRPADSKGAFDEFRKMNQEPRNMKLARVDDDIPDAFNPYLEQSEFLKPGETLEDWQPNPFLKPHADGGQVVIGKPGGLVEPGIEYYGKKKIATEGMSRALKWYHEKGKFIRSFQPKTITINKKPLKVTVTKFKQTDADAITKGLKQIEQWKKNPTKQNWVDIFRNPDTGQSSDFSKNVRKFLQGKKIDAKAPVEVFNKIKLKKVIGADAAKIIKTYDNFIDIRQAAGTKEAAKVNRARVDSNILKMRPVFAKNPNASIEDLAKSIFKDFDKVNDAQKVDYLQQTADSVKEFSTTLLGQRKVKGFRVMPKAKEIIKYIDNNTDIYGRFREGTIRDYKFAVKDSLLKVSDPTQTSKRLRSDIAARKSLRVIDEAVGLSTTFKNAPGYTEATQFLKNKTNKLKATKIDRPFREAFDAALEGDFTFAKKYNKAAKEFIKKNPKVDVPLFEIGKSPEQTVKHFSKYSPNAQKDMLRIANKHGFSLKVNSLPLSGKEGLAAKYKTAKGLTGKKKTAAYTALGLTVGGAAVADENIENQINTFGTAQAADGAQATGFTTGEKTAVGAGAAGAYKFRKPIIKAAGKTLSALTGPLPIAGMYAIPGFGMDPKSSIDRSILGAELAFAPSMVKQAQKFRRSISNPLLRKIATVGTMGIPKYAIRAARIASPIGIASLAGEGLYHLGKKGYDQYQLMKGMTEQEKSDYLADQYEDLGGVYGEGAADGGLIGDKSGPAPTGGPMSQGLRSLYNNDMDY